MDKFIEVGNRIFNVSDIMFVEPWRYCSAGNPYYSEYAWGVLITTKDGKTHPVKGIEFEKFIKKFGNILGIS